MVAYFDAWAPLEVAARALQRSLAGCPAQGVPFTAQFGDSPLLSWGIDPAEESAAPKWMARESWRLWVTNRLAAGLLAAVRSGTPSSPREVEPWRFAMERLRLEGVDTDTWTPQSLTR